MPDEARFKCLRCGHEYSESYSSDVVVERSCPQCRSNSVRRIKMSSKDHSKKSNS